MWHSGKESTCNAAVARGLGSIPRSRRPPGVGNGNLFQYFCLENPKDRGAWHATVHGVAKSRTQLSTHAGIQQRTWVSTVLHEDLQLNCLKHCSECISLLKNIL